MQSKYILLGLGLDLSKITLRGFSPKKSIT
jgi:hypothetical protein